MLVVFYFHSARFFDEGWWHIKNEQVSLGMAVFTGFVSQWIMPLFFLISGAASWFSLRFRTGGQYALERVKRLLIPFIFGTLVIIPPQVYLERIHNAQFHGSYLQFYPHFFEWVYPEGNFSWHHLWFLIYLFVFSLLALPVFLYLRKEVGRRFISWLAGLCEKPGGIFLLAVPIAIIEIALRPKFDGLQNLYADWANFLSSLTVFIYGYLFYSDARFGEAVRRHGKAALVMGVLTFSVGAALALTDHEPQRGYSVAFALWMILVVFNLWFWIVAILGLGQRILSFSSRLLQYANQAVLPFYILHQTVIIVIGFYVVQWNKPLLVKYLVISTAALFATIILYDLLIKRTSVTRFFFGMRPKKVGH